MAANDPATDPTWLAAADEASLLDRAYFELHPEADSYIRRRIVGEFGPHEGTRGVLIATHTRVWQAAPGVRFREPYVVLRGRDYGGGGIPLEHIEAALEQTGKSFDDLLAIDDAEIDD